MKAIRLMSMAAVAAFSMVMMTSCLGDTNDNFNGTAYAVGRTATGKTLIDAYTTYYGILPLYSASSQAWAEPTGCYLVDYDVNSNDADNKNFTSNGYYVATLTKSADIDKGYTVPSAADTSALQSNEQVLANAAGVAYIDYYLFIASAIDEPEKQQNVFTLYGQGSQSMKTGTDNVPYFDLFLRCVKMVEASGTSSVREEDRAFEIQNWVTSFTSVAKAAGKSSYKIKINYPSKVSSTDSTVTWSSFTLTVPIS